MGIERSCPPHSLEAKNDYVKLPFTSPEKTVGKASVVKNARDSRVQWDSAAATMSADMSDVPHRKNPNDIDSL